MRSKYYLTLGEDILQTLGDVLIVLVADSLEELVEPDLVKEDGGDSVEGVEGVDDDHEDEPEPHCQVHLLINDVLQQKYSLNKCYHFVRRQVHF